MVTAGALHTRQGHVRFLVEEKRAHFLLLVKANQPDLFTALRSLPWKEVTARRYDREAGHGRRETRATRVLAVTGLGLDFPHVVQAARILRYRVNATSGKCTRQTVYAITDLTSAEATPQKIAQLARSQWTIENRLHHDRDTTFAEDASKIRTGHGPANMATLRNLAINALRAAGHRSIAAGLREISYSPSPARSSSWSSTDQHRSKIPRTLNQPCTLGIHTDVAVAWQRLSAGDSANYAAEVSRRSRKAPAP